MQIEIEGGGQLKKTADGMGPKWACPSPHLHSVVLLIAHVNEAECIGCYAPRIIEFAICGALRTEGAQESSLRIEHLYAMIVSAIERERRCTAGKVHYYLIKAKHTRFSLKLAFYAE